MGRLPIKRIAENFEKLTDVVRAIAGGSKNPSELLETSTSAMFVVGVVTLIACFLIPAPYGKHVATRGWGPLISAKLAWFLMELPNLIIPVGVYIFYGGLLPPMQNNMLMACFLLHYVNRAIIYPLKMKECQPMPASVALLAYLYTTWNAYTQSLSLLVVNPIGGGKGFSEYQYYGGMWLFFLGMFINMQSDNILLALRGGKTKSGKGYVIPRGGFFEYVSCANYFGEILEWVGFAISCDSLPAWAFAFYTFANLAPRAYKHHQWYKNEFKDYPIKRKALIPFIW